MSHGRGGIQDPDLFAHILRDQLKIDAPQFWAPIDRGIRPRRPVPDAAASPPDALDAKLVRNLLIRVGLEPSQVANLTQAEAVQIGQRWLTEGGADSSPP